jgi:hypothetical protein
MLVGCVAGVAARLMSGLARLFQIWLGLAPPRPDFLSTRPLLGARGIVAEILADVVVSIFLGLAVLLLFFLLRTMLRRQWAAAAGFILIFTISNALQSDTPVVAVVAGTIIYGLLVLVLLRFGVVAAMVMFFSSYVLQRFPVTPHASAWYAGISVAGLLLIGAVAFYGFYFSLGGRPIFGSTALED